MEIFELLRRFQEEPTRKICCELADYYTGKKQSLFYLQYALTIQNCSENDDSGLFVPGIIEDKLSLAYFNAGDEENYINLAHIYANIASNYLPNDERIRQNERYLIGMHSDYNPKDFLNLQIINYIKTNFPNQNTKILDVGPREGCWSYYLHSFYPNMDCLEVWEPYIKENDLYSKYKRVFLGNILDYPIEDYDLIIMGDVLEHLTEEDANKALNILSSHSKQFLIIVPYYTNQDDLINTYEVHRQPSLSREKFLNLYHQCDFLIDDDWRGCFCKKENKGIIPPEFLVFRNLDVDYYVSHIIIPEVKKLISFNKNDEAEVLINYYNPFFFRRNTCFLLLYLKAFFLFKKENYQEALHTIIPLTEWQSYPGFFYGVFSRFPLIEAFYLRALIHCQEENYEEAQKWLEEGYNSSGDIHFEDPDILKKKYDFLYEEVLRAQKKIFENMSKIKISK